jgi:protein phosphatase
LERGLLKPEQARGHPNAHVIRRYLGSPTPPEVDFRLRMAGLEGDNQALSNQGSFMLPGDRMLLCSDGLTDLVEAEEILHYFQSLPREEAVDALIRLANERGGHDNITLVAIESPMPQAKPKKKFPTRLVVVGCLSMFIVFLAVMGLLAGGLLIRSVLEPTPTVPVGAPTLSLPQIATPLENRLFKTATATPEVSTPTLRPTQSQAPVNGTPQPVSTSLPVPNQAVPEPTATVQLPILLK